MTDYNIDYSDKLKPVLVVKPRTVNTELPIELFGSQSVEYGEGLQRNEIIMLENFASPTPPQAPITGMAWFNTTDKKLYFWNEKKYWRSIPATYDSAFPSSPVEGDIYVDSATMELSIFTTEWIKMEKRQSFDANVATYLSLDGARPMTGPLRINDVPSTPKNVVNKEYVDQISLGIISKDSVDVATTMNITLSGLQNIDGVDLVDGDRVLVKDQALTKDNGIYVATSIAWSRSADFADPLTIKNDSYVFVERGTSNADSGWIADIPVPYIPNSSAILFDRFTGLGHITAGPAINKSNNTLSVQTDADDPLINQLSVDSHGLYIKGPINTTTSGNNITCDNNGFIIQIDQIDNQGPQGPQGDQGPRGIKGLTGDRGPVGSPGAQGIQGEQGNKGLKGLTGAGGPIGDAGTNGIDGVQGDQGDQGPTGAKGYTGNRYTPTPSYAYAHAFGSVPATIASGDVITHDYSNVWLIVSEYNHTTGVRQGAYHFATGNAQYKCLGASSNEASYGHPSTLWTKM